LEISNAQSGRWNILLEGCCVNVIIREQIDDFMKNLTRMNRWGYCDSHSGRRR